RPGGPQRRLFVAHLGVPPDQEIKQFPVFPNGPQINLQQTPGRPEYQYWIIRVHTRSLAAKTTIAQARDQCIRPFAKLDHTRRTALVSNRPGICSSSPILARIQRSMGNENPRLGRRATSRTAGSPIAPTSSGFLIPFSRFSSAGAATAAS